MYRQLSFIFLLAGALTALLVFRPWEAFKEKPPRFYDRLPDADIIGKCSILDLSRSFNASLYHYKIPFREFLSHEFILSQGKTFGVDVQRPAYFFMNQEKFEFSDFGTLLMVTDSSKISTGLDKLSKFVALKDTIINDQRVSMNRKQNVYFSYGSNWLLIYHGDKFTQTLSHVVNAKHNEIPPKWRDYLNNHLKTKSSISVYASFKELHDYGVSSLNATISNDSNSVTINASLYQKDTIAFKLKNKGFAFKKGSETENFVNFNLDVERLKKSPNDPLYKFLVSLGKKISFPTKELINAWTGDLSFRQGGMQSIQEKYIESELDDDFNITEVVKYKSVQVPAFSLYLSLNNKGQIFLNKLFQKGILTNDGSKYRILFSPPLGMKFNDSTLIFHTSTFSPKMVQDSINSAVWSQKNTKYEFYIDAAKTKSIHGRIKIPLDQFVKNILPKQ
jgi:hypothetical protein